MYDAKTMAIVSCFSCQEKMPGRMVTACLQQTKGAAITVRMSIPPEDPETPDTERNVSEPLRRAISERYLTYALSTIMHRALPDVRDGLKPVHRRILFAMRELRLTSTGGFRKSAKISGDVMGNYHPHGDTAIYDAMARLAQDFAMRYRLVDGQGNFGNIDGDNPAASRYTEARLAIHSEILLDGLAENAVDFRPNYDGTLQEPVVLPAQYPNLLANGASGIAVGMATSIPPHNINELINACLALIAKPETTVDDLLKHVPGPDFPTGGILVESAENIAQAYQTGRGGFRLRAVHKIEDLGRGQWHIVVTEIPYGVQKSKLIERIAEVINAKKIPVLGDVRDESADDIRLILEPKTRNVDPDVLMGALYRNTDLELRIPLNMNVLIDGVTPKVSDLKQVLQAFLNFRREILQRRTAHRIEKIDQRLEILAGLIIAFLNLDRVIDIIRYDDTPKPALMREDWSRDFVRATDQNDYVSPENSEIASLSEVQAEAILNMRLRALRRLEEIELIAERDRLVAEREDLNTLLGSDARQWTAVSEQLRSVQETFGANAEGGARRTVIAAADVAEDVPLEALIEREPITVICSKMGWVRAMSGHIDLEREIKYKDGDDARFIFHAETTDKLVLFASNGRFYTLQASNLPGGRGMGEPVRIMLDLENDVTLLDFFIHETGRRLLVASEAGDGFIVQSDDVIAQTRAGKQVLNVKDGIKAKICKPVDGDSVAVVGENRKVLVFDIAELPEMARGKGVRLQKYKDGGLSDATTFTRESGLSWKDPAGRTRTQSDLTEWIAKRAGTGRMAPRGFPRDNTFT
jgi:topoisomerase IV subunit A